MPNLWKRQNRTAEDEPKKQKQNKTNWKRELKGLNSFALPKVSTSSAAPETMPQHWAVLKANMI